MATFDNLLIALGEEHKNRQLFLAFAEKADAEGAPQVARLFRATAEAERIHAEAQLTMLNTVRSTRENLIQAIATEEREFQDLYVKFLRESQEEGNQPAIKLLTRIMESERLHHNLFSAALEAMDAGRQAEPTPVHVCSFCGNIVIGHAASPCSICGKGPEVFTAIA